MVTVIMVVVVKSIVTIKMRISAGLAGEATAGGSFFQFVHFIHFFNIFKYLLEGFVWKIIWLFEKTLQNKTFGASFFHLLTVFLQ